LQNMIQRQLSECLKAQSREFPVVTLTGPRQSGKTTLVRSVFAGHEYCTLEELDVRLAAREDPRGFLNSFKGPVILDEVQNAPGLLSYIQGAVDRGGDPGRYILTGSQHLALMEGVSQTLAGRTAVLHLLPCSLKETGVRGTLDETMFRGGFPAVVAGNRDATSWQNAYIQTYIDRDVRAVRAIGDLAGFQRFVQLCASRVGTLLNLASLAADCGVALNTAKAWISVLETGFVVMLLRPYHRNFGKRLTKHPKLFFTDTGTVCALLGIREPGHLAKHPLRGAIFENLVVGEFLKAMSNRARRQALYFWRDHTGNEVDLLVGEETNLVGVEVKSGATVASDWARGLTFFQNVSGTALARAEILHGGENSLPCGIARAIPWTRLAEEDYFVEL
jgi:predicted AAA+ superfamily ATPase